MVVLFFCFVIKVSRNKRKKVLAEHCYVYETCVYTHTNIYGAYVPKSRHAYALWKS